MTVFPQHHETRIHGHQKLYSTHRAKLRFIPLLALAAAAVFWLLVRVVAAEEAVSLKLLPGVSQTTPKLAPLPSYVLAADLGKVSLKPFKLQAVSSAAAAESESATVESESTNAAAAIAAYTESSAASANCERDGKDCRVSLWMVSTRSLPVCPRNMYDAKFALEYNKGAYNKGCATWTKSTEEEYLASEDASMPTVIYIHGNLAKDETAQDEGLSSLQSMLQVCTHCRLRFVIWSWPSEKNQPRFITDARTKGSRSEYQGYYLARFLLLSNRTSKTTLLGYSYGARMSISALHLLGGGELYGFTLAEAVKDQSQIRPVNAVLLAAAIPNDTMIDGGRHELAMKSVERMLVTVNARDPVLKMYRLVEHDRCIQALGSYGLPCNACCSPLNTDGKMHLVDVSCWLGRTHRLSYFFDSPEVANYICDYVNLETKK